MKTKVFLVTGFLGSGKTTLLKRILNFSTDLSKTVVLVNEFGKVGIDSALIKSTAAADIVELNSGCICCSLRTDMIQALQSIQHDYSPERIIMEATGVADPLSIIEALEDTMLAPHFSLEKTITILDGDFWEAREAFGTVFQSQLKQADLILLNKIDTLDSSDISIILQEINEEAFKGSVIPTLHCNIDPEILWSNSAPKEKNHIVESPFKTYDPETDFYSSINQHETLTAKDAGFITFSFETSKILDENQFMAFLDRQPLELFRIKGPARFADKTKMLNYVGTKSQWQQWPKNTNTCLVFIGWGVIEEQILSQLNACLVCT